MNDDFEAFFRREFHPLVRFLLARGVHEQTAADAAQEAMQAAYRQWVEIDNPVGWVRTTALRRVARETRTDTARNKRNRLFTALRHCPDPPDPAHLVELADESRAVVKRISELPAARRMVVALVFDGFDTKEIAQQLGIAEATVRSHVRHARRALREDQPPQNGGAA